MIRKSMFAAAASLMTLIAFSGALAVMSVPGQAPVAQVYLA